MEKFNLKDLNTLPILTKQELRRFGTTTLLSNKIDKKGTFFSSSGSTGTPTKIYFSRKFHQKWSAVFEARIRNWAGITYKSPRATIGEDVFYQGQIKPPHFIGIILLKNRYIFLHTIYLLIRLMIISMQ